MTKSCELQGELEAVQNPGVKPCIENTTMVKPFILRASISQNEQHITTQRRPVAPTLSNHLLLAPFLFLPFRDFGLFAWMLPRMILLD